MLELYQPIVNFGVLVVIAAMYLWQTPKTIEKVTKVIESNTNVIRESQLYHQKMETMLEDMKKDIEYVREKVDDNGNAELLDKLVKIQEQLNKLGK